MPDRTPSAAQTREVVFTETGETRVVLRGCSVCGADPDNPQIVSSRGVAHESGGYGMTDCGRDATGDRWWWAE